MSKRVGFLLLAVPFCTACWFKSTSLAPTKITQKMVSAETGGSGRETESASTAPKDVIAEIENVLYAPRPKGADSDERRTYFERAIERDPTSAKKHFEYAEFLLDEALYSEADKELEEVLKLDPKYPGSARLRNSINKVADEVPEKRDYTAVSEFLDRPIVRVEILPMPEEPGKTPAQVQAEATAGVEADRARLTAQYAGLERYKAEHEEFMRSSLIQQYGWDGDWEGASRQFERVRKDFPESPYPASVYASALISGSHLEEAGTLVSEARRKYPNDLALKVTADLLAEIQQGKLAPDFVGTDLTYRLSLVSAR